MVEIDVVEIEQCLASSPRLLCSKMKKKDCVDQARLNDFWSFQNKHIDAIMGNLKNGVFAFTRNKQLSLFYCPD